jgi:hypothetical protein
MSSTKDRCSYSYLRDALLDGGCGCCGLTYSLENLLQTCGLRAPRRHFTCKKTKANGFEKVDVADF